MLNGIYEKLRPYTNCFQPSMKLTHRTRDGTKVTKTYHKANTPYRSLLESGSISRSSEDRLKEEYLSVNPAKFNREIESLRKKLNWINQRKGNQVTEDEVEENEESLEYILL